MSRAHKNMIQLTVARPKVTLLPLDIWKAKHFRLVEPVILPDWKMRARARRQEREQHETKSARIRRLAIFNTVAPLLTKEEWEWIKQRYYQRCAYCRQIKPLTKDHILPLSKGGQHTKANIIPACKSCNSRKGNRPAMHYNPVYFPYD